MNTKEIIQGEFKRLEKKYNLLDYGFDWLRFWIDVDFNFMHRLEKEKFNSTTWNGIYNFPWFDLVMKTKWKQGVNYNFIRNFKFNDITKPINMFAITQTNKKNNIGYKYMINFYWIFFQLWRLKKIDTNLEIKNITWSVWLKIKITRLDYNFNFNFKDKKEIQETIKRLARKYEDINNTAKIRNETFYIRYYESKGRNENGQKINGETRTLWVKFYDKSQNISDLWIEEIYYQYDKKAVLRLEFMLWSKALNLKNNPTYRTWKIEDLESLVNQKIFWQEKIIDSQNTKEERVYKTVSYIKKTKSMTECYLKKYFQAGGVLKDLVIDGYNITDYIEKKQELDEIIFT